MSKLQFWVKVFKENYKGLSTVRIDASSMCQLKCLLCPTSQGSNRRGIVGWGYLTFNDFRKFVDSYKQIKTIELSNWGEIFLNPEINNIIKYSYDKNIALIAKNGTNLNTISEETIQCLVAYQFKYLSISLDGATNTTYQIYRRNGNFEKVIEHIRLINYYKQKYKSEYPHLRWQFIIFGHNEHEMPLARAMAKDLNMEFYLKLSYDSHFSPVRDKEFVKKVGGIKYVSREEYKQQTKREYALPCKQLWVSPQINWDGKLLGCCANTHSDFGNIFETDLEHCMNSERYRYAKEMLRGKKKARDDIPCSHCYIYTSSEEPVLKMF